MYLTKLTDVEIKGSFDGVVFIWTNFAGSKGAVMDLNEAKKAKQYGANLTNVEIIGLDKSQEIKQQIANSFQKIKKSKN